MGYSAVNPKPAIFFYALALISGLAYSLYLETGVSHKQKLKHSTDLRCSMGPSVFSKTSKIPASVQDVFQWHERTGALERLIPPWDPLEVVFKTPGIHRGAQTVMKIPARPFPFKLTWIAAHTDYVKNRRFQDVQIKGPFKQWTHTHSFMPDGDGCLLKDHIAYALPAYMLGPLFGNALIHRKLKRIFRFRHTILSRDLSHHRKHAFSRPMTILISGASGVIGSALIPFLTTGGHRVIRLVRNQHNRNPQEVYWNPAGGKLDLQNAGPIDVAIHLSGENIGQDRWTPEKKQRIIESRNQSTRLMARTLARLPEPPRAMLCASAIGFYGDRGDDLLTESNECGADFISGVCSEWEAGTLPAAEKGIRVVFLRIGVVLTPRGGALKKFLLPFSLGLGGKIGSGAQYLSWISIDDLIYAIYHIMADNRLQGPVNLVSPNPVPNAEFSQTLGSILNRPTLLSVPAGVIRGMYGEMGREILLASTRVMPQQLLQTGFSFAHPDLASALRHLLGK